MSFTQDNEKGFEVELVQWEQQVQQNGDAEDTTKEVEVNTGMKILNSNNMVFEDLDQITINYRPYFIFVIWYLFNAVFVLPIFIIKAFLNFLFDFFLSMWERRFLQGVKIFFYYSIDILMALSVLSAYPLAVLPPRTQNNPVDYQVWAISNLIFLQSYVLLQSYILTIVKNRQTIHPRDLVAFENMHSLGLGRLISRLTVRESDLNNKNQLLKKDLMDTINEKIESENIEPTLFFFSLNTDKSFIRINELQHLTVRKIEDFVRRAQNSLTNPIIQQYRGDLSEQEIESLNRRNHILRIIRPQGFKGKRHLIDNFLWPHYQYIHSMEHESLIKMIAIIAAILFIKMSFPLYMIYQSSEDKLYHLSIVSQFMGMQLNMISILIGLIINDDLKGKQYILNVLLNMLSLPGEDDLKEDSDEFDSGQKKNIQYKLDISCNLSLECWDNARRLIYGIDPDKLDLYELTFSFLGLYMIYAYLILSQDFLGIKLFHGMDQFFSTPIQEWNTFIDFLMITVMFLIRIKEGTQYNSQFGSFSGAIQKVISILESQKALFYYYYDHQLIFNIQNKTYKNIIQHVTLSAAEKVVYDIIRRKKTTISPARFKLKMNQLSKQRMGMICASMEKLQTQIKFDSENCCHKFMGWFKSDISKIFATFFILIYVFFHGQIKAYLNKYRKKTPGDN